MERGGKPRTGLFPAGTEKCNSRKGGSERIRGGDSPDRMLSRLRNKIPGRMELAAAVLLSGIFFVSQPGSLSTLDASSLPILSAYCDGKLFLLANFSVGAVTMRRKGGSRGPDSRRRNLEIFSRKKCAGRGNFRFRSEFRPIFVS